MALGAEAIEAVLPLSSKTYVAYVLASLASAYYNAMAAIPVAKRVAAYNYVYVYVMSVIIHHAFGM